MPYRENLPISLKLRHSTTQRSNWRLVWTKRLYNPIYLGVLITVTLMYSLTLFLVDVDRYIIIPAFKGATEVPGYILSTIYTLDLLANLIIVGPMRSYKKRKVLIFETLLSIGYWSAILYDQTSNSIADDNVSRYSQINAFFQLRSLRVFELLIEIKEFQIISSTMKNLTAPILSKLLFLYMVYYLYSIMGSWLYGGQITINRVSKYSPSSPPFYYLLNFNSFASGLVTLFHFMIVNNWIVTIQMYQAIVDPYTFPEIFFITFWCSVTVILMNVIVALIIEIYSSVEPDVTRKRKQVNLTRQLM